MFFLLSPRIGSFLLLRKQLSIVRFPLELSQLNEEISKSNLESNRILILFSKSVDERVDLRAVANVLLISFFPHDERSRPTFVDEGMQS